MNKLSNSESDAIIGFNKAVESLLDYGSTNSEVTTITVALESKGIMVGCDGESAFLTAEEALNLGIRLEFVAVGEAWQDRGCRDLIELLRHGVNVLNNERSERGLHGIQSLEIVRPVSNLVIIVPFVCLE